MYKPKAIMSFYLYYPETKVQKVILVTPAISYINCCNNHIRL